MKQKDLFPTKSPREPLDYRALIAQAQHCYVCDTLLGKGDCRTCAAAREVNAMGSFEEDTIRCRIAE